MPKLKINLAELAMAFEGFGDEASNYLDLATGRVIRIDRQLLRELGGDDDLLFEDDGEEPEVQSGPEEEQAPDWMRDVRAEADEVAAGLGTRYIEVPRANARDGYRDMADFIDTVEDKRLQSRLWNAIEGRGAFRRFKDHLVQHFHERERWFAFKDTRVEERMRAWLQSEEIELIEDPNEKVRAQQRKAEELVNIRLKLIAEVLAFVRAARELPGVVRIALFGSLTTDRPDPKDADLLVAVTDDTDLTALAHLARRLQGRAQGLNRGGDVFLANPQGRHLGRTCPWKECAPGIRQSCAALHCGQRHYLHDDLQRLTLSGDVVTAPAVELWPRIVERVRLPEDVMAELIVPLRAESKP